MKKFNFAVSLVIFVFFFAACGSDNKNESKNPGNSNSSDSPEQEDEDYENEENKENEDKDDDDNGNGNGNSNNNADCSQGSYKCKDDNSYLCDNDWIFYASCDNGCDSVTGQCNPRNEEDEEFAELIRQNRVAVKLTWKQGFKTEAEAEINYDGEMVDLNLHLIKRNSLEAETYGFYYTEGLLGTTQRMPINDCSPTVPVCERYWRHDDCSFTDQGYNDSAESIQWNAKFLGDNYWGGGDYKNPEIIVMGTTGEDDIVNDQYLVVVGYIYCSSSHYPDDRCDPSYNEDDSAYEIDARVEIFVDGKKVPRNGTYDMYSETTKDFKIKLNEWKAVAVIKWDSGNATVTDSAMSYEGITTDPKHHPVCYYDNSDAYLIPIWDAEEYRKYIETPDEHDYKRGYCE